MAHYGTGQEASRRRPRHYAEYALLCALVFVLRLLPFRAALWVACRLGDFAFDVIRIRRRVTLENLQAALGATRSAAELMAIARSCYRNFAATFVELAVLAPGGAAAAARRMRVSPQSHVADAAARGRGVIYLTAHIGNWEMLGACMGLIDEPLHVVVGDQRNLLVDRYVNGLREALGMRVIPMGASLKGVMRALRRGERVALVADQNAGPDGVFIDFLGRPAATALGPAHFAYRSGAPIVIGLDRRLENGRHETRLYPPLIADRSRPAAEETRRILTEYMRILEDFVRRHPDQWFWMHRRWKTQPSTGGSAHGGSR
jgi:KDO2-lipid IV(A) lauroyltransferase